MCLWALRTVQAIAKRHFLQAFYPLKPKSNFKLVEHMPIGALIRFQASCSSLKGICLTKDRHVQGTLKAFRHQPEHVTISFFFLPPYLHLSG